MPMPFETRFARRLAPVGTGFALAVSCLQAWSQSGFNADVMKNYGGNYAIACQDAGAPRLRVTPNSLVFAQGGKSITGRDVQAAYSYFGNSPPANYRVALMSQVKGNTSMVFIVYEDKQGQYITLDVDDKLAAALGKARLSARYRYCDGPRAEAAGQPLAVPPPASKPAGPAAADPQYGFDLFQNPQFKVLAHSHASAGCPSWRAPPDHCARRRLAALSLSWPTTANRTIVMTTTCCFSTLQPVACCTPGFSRKARSRWSDRPRPP